MEAVAYLGLLRETEVVLDVIPDETGIVQVDCFECDGAGDWPYYPDDHIEDCVVCKGTGKVYING